MSKLVEGKILKKIVDLQYHSPPTHILDIPTPQTLTAFVPLTSSPTHISMFVSFLPSCLFLLII